MCKMLIWHIRRNMPLSKQCDKILLNEHPTQQPSIYRIYFKIQCMLSYFNIFSTIKQQILSERFFKTFLNTCTCTLFFYKHTTGRGIHKLNRILQHIPHKLACVLRGHPIIFIRGKKHEFVNIHQLFFLEVISDQQICQGSKSDFLTKLKYRQNNMTFI